MASEPAKTEHSNVVEGAVAIARDAAATFDAPLKVVTGHQTTSGLNFELKPGAIVAHEGSTVIFVCG